MENKENPWEVIKDRKLLATTIITFIYSDNRDNYKRHSYYLEDDSICEDLYKKLLNDGKKIVGIWYAENGGHLKMDLDKC